MEFFKNLGAQLRGLWYQASLPARIGFVGTAVLCVAALIGVGIWASRPQYVPLAANLAPSEAAEIVSQLDAEGIRNQMNFSGSTVLVPKSQWNRSRLLLGDMLGPLPPGAEQLDDSLLSDPTLNHYKVLRNREESLSRTIMRMEPIAKATVHIAQSEPSPFIQEQKPTTASVVLEIKPGATFTREQAAAVVSLVASSVESLEPSAVSVLDTSGRLLSSNGAAADTEMTFQFEYRRNVEASLASKAELLLDELLGPGRAIVRVAADIDFTRSERTQTSYDSDNQVKKSERIKTKTRTGGSADAQGPAGTASNQNITLSGTGNKTPFRDSEEESEVEYETAKTIDTIKEEAGKIERLTVAALVDLDETNATADDQGEPAVTKEQIEGIVKQAVGFDQQRGDQVEVVVSKMAGAAAATDEDLVQTQKWQFYTDLARNISLGLAAVVALILGLLILRRMRPITFPGGAETADSLGQARTMAELNYQARQDPDAVARIVAHWLEEDREGEDPHETENRRKAA